MKQSRSINLILGIALVILIIAALLLPPISLPQRFANRGMTSIPAATSSDISDPDGTRVAFPAYGVPSGFRAKLASVPRDRFLNGEGGEAARAAANALARDVLEQGEPAAKRYLDFLKAGDSVYPLEALKIAGIDMTKPEPIERGFAVLASMVDELEKLIG